MIVPVLMTVTLGMIVYFLGAFLTRHVGFLRDYSIPEPVAGGLVVALLTWGYYLASGVEITFDTRIRDYLLVVFFTTVGLNARITDLFRSGPLIAAGVGLLRRPGECLRDPGLHRAGVKARGGAGQDTTARQTRTGRLQRWSQRG